MSKGKVERLGNAEAFKTPDLSGQIPVPRSMFQLPDISGKSEGKEEYWFGLLPKCPYQWIAVGGITFIKYTNPPIGVDKDTGLSQRQFIKGDYVKLTQSEVRRVMERLSKMVLRWVRRTETKAEDEEGSKRPKAMVYKTDNVRYARTPNDEPLAQHVFFMKVASIDAEWTRNATFVPPSVLDMAQEDEPVVMADR